MTLQRRFSPLYSLGLWIALIITGLLGNPAFAAVTPSAGALDARLRTVQYQRDDVVLVTADVGFQLMVEFADDEHIENIALGDSLSWQINPNKIGNLLFIKPVDASSETNMAVVTDQRRYHFLLTAREGDVKPRERLFNLRFLYPDAPATEPAASTTSEESAVASELADTEQPPTEADGNRLAVLNFDYGYKGSKRNLPERVFDDGEQTFLYWPRGQALPAMFEQDRDGQEQLINFTVANDYVVLPGVYPTLVLRNGRRSTQLLNRQHQPQTQATPLPSVLQP